MRAASLVCLVLPMSVIVALSGAQALAQSQVDTPTTEGKSKPTIDTGNPAGPPRAYDYQHEFAREHEFERETAGRQRLDKESARFGVPSDVNAATAQQDSSAKSEAVASVVLPLVLCVAIIGLLVRVIKRRRTIGQPSS